MEARSQEIVVCLGRWRGGYENGLWEREGGRESVNGGKSHQVERVGGGKVNGVTFKELSEEALSR